MCATRWPAPRPRTRHGIRRYGPGVLGEAPCRLRQRQRQPKTHDVDVPVGQPRRHRLEATDRPVDYSRSRAYCAVSSSARSSTPSWNALRASAPRVLSHARTSSPPTSLLASTTTPREFESSNAAESGGGEWRHRDTVVTTGDEENATPERFRQKPGRRRRFARTRSGSWCPSAGTRLRLNSPAPGLRPSHRRVPP